MKQHGHLWEGVISYVNLLRAAHAAARGKRFKPGIARFFFHLEPELLRLHEELVSKTYRPGPYRTFTIYEGKTRQISAAPFRDRVVHHALTGVLEPIFERSFLQDSYACRRGKGTHGGWHALVGGGSQPPSGHRDPPRAPPILPPPHRPETG